MENRCIHCGSELQDGACPRCKKNQDDHNPKNLLEVGQILCDRLWVGKVISQDGEGATYLGFDSQLGKTILLREFFPENLCQRQPDGSITVNTGSELAFKNALTAFVDLHKMLNQAEEQDAVQEVYGAYKANNTVYASLEYFDGASLQSVLHSTTGDIEQKALLNILKPLFKTLQVLHKMGMIHGGICPENILINSEGQVRLVGFATNSLRTANTEIQSQLFDGYTSPEQYSMTGWQGPWTDIYALGATLYRALTGTRPQKACDRLRGDVVIAANELNQEIDLDLTNAIEFCLKLNYKERIKSIEELAEFISGEKRTTEAKIIQEEQQKTHPAAAKSKTAKKKLPAWAVAVIIVAVVVLTGLVFWAVTRSGKKPITPQESSSTASTLTKVKVPDVVGMTFTAFSDNKAYKGEEYTFKVEHEFSDIYDEGTICGVSPTPGKEIEAGETITIKVSKGKEKIDVPSIVGKNLEEVTPQLDKLNIKYEIIEMFQEGTGGTVLRYEGDTDGKVVPGQDILYIYAIAIV